MQNMGTFLWRKVSDVPIRVILSYILLTNGPITVTRGVEIASHAGHCLINLVNVR